MSTFRRIASRLEEGFDTARMHLRRLTGFDDPVTVHVHRGFGTRERLHVAGSVAVRAEEGSGRRPAIVTDIRATLGRYVERGVMGARLTIRHGDAEATAVADSDGFFHAELPFRASIGNKVEWVPVEVRLEKVPGGRHEPSDFAGEVMVPPPSARFGVISDIDDTVMRTGIHDFRRNWRQVIRSDPSLREAFPGLAELYRALTHDPHGMQRNPVFYVSSAAWGFYDLFAEFMAHRELPMGPLFLKNYGLDDDKWFSGDHATHKSRAIERLFETYPDMPFILVGDSGQHDAMIYRDTVARHPDRVLAVWIREVTDSPDRRSEIEALVREVEEAGVPAALGPDLLVAARQAAENGWMSAEAVRWVEESVETERQKPA